MEKIQIYRRNQRERRKKMMESKRQKSATLKGKQSADGAV